MSRGICGLVAILGACSFRVAASDGGTVADDAGDDAADALTDGVIDTAIDAPPPTCSNNCDDGDPCTDDACVLAQCQNPPIALPLGCAGVRFRCGTEPTCYVHCPAASTWTVSQGSCALWGGHLTTVTTSAESTCIGQRLTTSTATRAWIGYVQAALGAEPGGGWGWSSGAASVFTDWIAMQPNNDGDQDCAFAEEPSGRWYDHECFVAECGYICEK